MHHEDRFTQHARQLNGVIVKKKMNEAVLNLNAKKTLIALLIINVILLLLFILSSFLIDEVGLRGFYRIIAARLDVGAEVSIPTWYNQTILVIGAALFFAIAMLKKSRENFRRVWLFLGIIFAAMSLDEGASLHETLMHPMNKNFELGDGVFYFSWVIPVGILVLLVFALLLKFYIKLPVKYRVIFGAAAAVYIGGAIGMEMWGAYYVSGDPIYHVDGLWDYKLTLLTGIEEFMEMTGIAILIYGQILYLSEHESIQVKSRAS